MARLLLPNPIDDSSVDRTSIGFVDHLGTHGDRVSIIDEHGRPWSYAELDREVDAMAARLGPRRLTLVRMRNDLASVIAELGALRAGHAVVLAEPGTPSERVAEVHDPDVVVSGQDIHEVRTSARHDLHPDLALLLSTSGSTGSAKLVRLSQRNLGTNAASIASSLGLAPTDRAITTLPLHYCFGLSVLHSHLAVGAGVALTSASVVDPCFWDTVATTRPTILPAVPHTIELLDRVDFLDRRLPHLRAVIQAGGRLDPDTVRRYARSGAEDGWDLYVMYGQTEATARMAYLPPALAIDRPDAVGVAIPGGSFHIEPHDDRSDGGGEVVFSGPNVMMGYAESSDDLARGHDHAVLHTGDIGRIAEDGLLEIVGRNSDFLKLFGLRVDLGQVRSHVGETGVDAVVDGDDDGITVAVLDGSDPAPIAADITTAFGLPRSAIAAANVADLPLLPSGKQDRAALRAAVRSAAEGPAETTDVRSVITAATGVRDIGDSDTFVSLGGDSLSYIEVSIALEGALGHLPDDWHLRTISDLETTAATAATVIPRVESNVVLRAIAIVLIVGNHAGTFLVPGGAHVLFAAAGFNFGRFRSGPSAQWRSIARIAAPSMLWIGGAAAFRDDFDLVHGLLLHGLLDGTGRWMYWFIEALVVVLVALAALLSVPAVRALEQRAPFAFACGILALTSLPRFDFVSIGPAHHSVYRPQEIAWLFALGWAMARAGSTPRLVLLSAVAGIGVLGYFDGATREALVLGGLLVLAWIPRLAIPRPFHRVVGAVASASLFIYLSHVQVFPEFDDPWIAVVASVAFGVALWRLCTPLLTATERRISQMQLSRM